MRQGRRGRRKKPNFCDFGFSPNLMLCIIPLKASQELLPASAKCENVRSVERNHPQPCGGPQLQHRSSHEQPSSVCFD
jgi:hypothetical protein